MVAVDKNAPSRTTTLVAAARCTESHDYVGGGGEVQKPDFNDYVGGMESDTGIYNLQQPKHIKQTK